MDVLRFQFPDFRKILIILLTIALFVLMFLASGCSAQWHVQRAVLKDPSILEYREVRLDTVVVTKPVQMTDTFTLKEYDTIQNVVNGIEYKIIRRVDTFKVDIKCPPDTVRIEVVKNVPQVMYAPKNWIERNMWWIFLVLGVFAIVYVVKKIALK